MRTARVIVWTGIALVVAALVRWVMFIIGPSGRPAPGWPVVAVFGVVLVVGGLSYAAGRDDERVRQRKTRATARGTTLRVPPRTSARPPTTTYQSGGPIASIPQGRVRQDASLTGGAGILGETPAGRRVVECAHTLCDEWFIWHGVEQARALGWLPDEAYAGPFAALVDEADRYGKADGVWWCRKHQSPDEPVYPS